MGKENSPQSEFSDPGSRGQRREIFIKEKESGRLFNVGYTAAFKMIGSMRNLVDIIEFLP